MQITMDGDRLTKPLSPERKSSDGDETGPTRPSIERPEGGNELLKRLKKVDPDQAKRYRQRSGQ
jgi:hypothetical protein